MAVAPARVNDSQGLRMASPDLWVIPSPPGARDNDKSRFNVAVTRNFQGIHVPVIILKIELVVAGDQLGSLILLEATLSFLGIGVLPPTPAWGSMLADARNYITQAWWTVLFPGLAISLVVMSVNFVGDTFRDRLDPALRG